MNSVQSESRNQIEQNFYDSLTLPLLFITYLTNLLEPNRRCFLEIKIVLYQVPNMLLLKYFQVSSTHTIMKFKILSLFCYVGEPNHQPQIISLACEYTLTIKQNFLPLSGRAQHRFVYWSTRLGSAKLGLACFTLPKTLPYVYGARPKLNVHSNVALLLVYQDETGIRWLGGCKRIGSGE